MAVKLLLPDQCRTVRNAALEAAGLLRDAAVQGALKSFSGSLACPS